MVTSVEFHTFRLVLIDKISKYETGFDNVSKLFISVIQVGSVCIIGNTVQLWEMHRLPPLKLYNVKVQCCRALREVNSAFAKAAVIVLMTMICFEGLSKTVVFF